MEDGDLLLARQLQEQFDRESAAFITHENVPITDTNSANTSSPCPSSHLQLQGLSVIDPIWETTDPNPDVPALFQQYNDQYFWGRLAGVEVKWSPRMTLCAGVCSYEGRGGLCSIRLSVPLLKLRPRKDLVETLLHEMIHAFLFVTDNDRDRDGHGPNFQKHMHRINKASGAKITIYHDFHDEVDNYRQHWWRCNGPCKDRRPYYGWVKRSMNRAPSAQDFWWTEHQQTCGGTYTKVKEPEGYGQKKKRTGEKDEKDSKMEKKSPNADIRSFLGKGQVLGGTGQIKTSGSDVNKKKPASTITNEILSKLNDVETVKGNKPATVSKGNNDGRTAGTGNNTKTVGKGNSTTTAAGKGTNATAAINDITADVEIPFELDSWVGGIWSQEENGNVSSSKTVSVGKNTNSCNTPGQGKSWTAVETDADKQKKDSAKGVNTKSAPFANTDTQGVQIVSASASGHVLGKESSNGLSWLAKMRKEWAKNNDNRSEKENVVSASLNESDQHESLKLPNKESSVSDIFSEVGGDSQFSKISSPISSEIVTKVSNRSINDDDDDSHFNDDSIHDSFHVSSCEIDEWPTPEKYYTKDKKNNSVISSKRKRNVLDLTSSDEEDGFLPQLCKRPKPPQTSSSPSASISESSASDPVNIFKKIKTKNASPVKVSDSKIKLSNSAGLQTASSTAAATVGVLKHQGVRDLSGFDVHSLLDKDFRADISEPKAASGSLVQCPSCQNRVLAAMINDHLDACLC